MFRTSTSSFERLLEKATSNLNLETDWPTIMQINDLIRQGDVTPKHALSSIKKKITQQNPHVSMFALEVLESCVKNCGSIVHDEVGSKAFMEQLRDIIKTTTNDKMRDKLLELIQTWAHALRKEPKYRAVQDTVNILKTEGFTFPAWKESDAMFVADSAPQWEDGERCNRCRTDFTLMNRKHHCRACGQVFCGQCSSKTSPIPRFGIEKEVRVCDGCFDKINKPSTTTSSSKDTDLPIEYVNSSLAQQSQAPPPRKSEDELKEDEELQLALALSQSEAEAKSKAKVASQPVTRTKSYSPPPKLSTSPEDPELARYLNRSYWQQQQRDFTRNPSAPIAQQQAPKQSDPQPSTLVAQPQTALHNGLDDEEIEEFVATLKSQVEIFVTRMKSNSSRGRSIANDSSVQTLFMNVTAMHSRLLRFIHQHDDIRVYYEGLQDKLCQVKDARAALDALREEHREKLRREAEIAERQRQMQMAQKLDIMRKKKQEYLQYQRQLALQRIQEQEREMQMRQEHQKQQYMMGPFNSLPYMHQNYENGPGMMPRFSGPPGVYPPFNPGAMPHMSGMHSMSGMPAEPMMVGTEQGMMMPGAPPPPMSHMSMPMAPPSQTGQLQIHPSSQNQMGNAPPPSHYHADAMMPGPHPQHMQPPPMGHPSNLPPMGAVPAQHMMAPPTTQPQMSSPPYQPTNQPPPQPEPEQKTAELISFD